MNQLSSFIDCTTVYGSTTKHMNLLKAADGMRLRMQDHETHGSMLPELSQFSEEPDFETIKKDFDNDKLNPIRGTSFVAGDNRVGEFPGKF